MRSPLQKVDEGDEEQEKAEKGAGGKGGPEQEKQTDILPGRVPREAACISGAIRVTSTESTKS
eukprot:468635-Pyramimonas_sp.AAC.1